MDFLTEQKRYERVRHALLEKESAIANLLKTIGFVMSDFHMLLVACKDEDRLELFVKKESENTYRHPCGI